MGEVVSKSEFARRVGNEPEAVSMWISRGKLTAPALRDDGLIDVDLAVEQLRGSLEHARSSTDLERAASAGAPEGGQSVTGALIEQQRRQRIEESELRLRRLRRDELEAAGKLVDAEAIAAAHTKAIEELLGAVEQWLPDLAVKLGAGREGIDVARREWRAFRQRQAGAASERFAGLPALTEAPSD